MIESKRVPGPELGTRCRDVRKRNVRDVDKEKTRNSRVSRRYVNIVSIPFVWYRNVGRHESYVFFPCRRYACYVYARRDTMF